jgi:hypothetical protein
MGEMREMKAMKRHISISPRPVRRIALWTPWGVLTRDERESARPEEPLRHKPASRPRLAGKAARPRRQELEKLA